MMRARLRYYTYCSRSFKAMGNSPRVLIIQLESRWFRRVQGETVVIWGRPEAVLSAIHSCDVRLVVKSQSDLQIASSIRIMSQHSCIIVIIPV